MCFCDKDCQTFLEFWTRIFATYLCTYMYPKDENHTYFFSKHICSSASASGGQKKSIFQVLSRQFWEWPLSFNHCGNIAVVSLHDLNVLAWEKTSCTHLKWSSKPTVWWQKSCSSWNIWSTQLKNRSSTDSNWWFQPHLKKYSWTFLNFPAENSKNIWWNSHQPRIFFRENSSLSLNQTFNSGHPHQRG